MQAQDGLAPAAAKHAIDATRAFATQKTASMSDGCRAATARVSCDAAASQLVSPFENVWADSSKLMLLITGLIFTYLNVKSFIFVRKNRDQN